MNVMEWQCTGDIITRGRQRASARGCSRLVVGVEVVSLGDKGFVGRMVMP
jgi:hypothetical protein